MRIVRVGFVLRLGRKRQGTFMSMRMRKKRNFEARMEACGDLLLAQGANGILNMKEAAENYRALVNFSAVFNEVSYLGFKFSYKRNAIGQDNEFILA